MVSVRFPAKIAARPVNVAEMSSREGQKGYGPKLAAEAVAELKAATT